jgi:hypothetical protein
MVDTIEIKQKNIVIDKKDIVKILNFENQDLIFLSGSLIEGSINVLSKGMGNKLSDIDVFILSDDIENIKSSILDYDRNYLKTQFKKLYGINFDIEIYSKQIILDLIKQLNEYNFDDNIRTFNALKLPNGFNLFDFTSFIHRFLNSISIYNEDKLEEIKHTLNESNYFKLMKRIAINQVDLYYEDVVGNIETGQFEVAVNTARRILLETIKAYIFHKKTSIDRDKWIPLKIKNLAEYDKEAAIVYTKFKKLYFEEKLDNDISLQANAEKIIDFSNNLINKIGLDGEI